MSLLDALRRHTRQQHEALHQHPLLLGLSADRITLAEFHRILLAFEAYYTHAEAACATPWPEQAPNAPVLAWLASDLAQHKLDSLADRLAFAHPPIDTPSRMAGYLYTKQGSTLGGHVISRHLERKLALIPHLDQWFFAGYHDNGVQWKQFIAALETIEGLDEAEVCAAACAAFDHISQVCSAVAALTPEPVA
jgi:heme oxygenase